MTDFSEAIKAFFGDLDKPAAGAQPIQRNPSISDKPEIKLFMAQCIETYGDMVKLEPIEWTKALRRKKSGDIFKMTIRLERIGNEKF